MLWVNLIMDTFAAMALSSLPPDRSVLRDKPRNPNSHIIDRRMIGSIVGGGMTFFFILVALWQFLWHKDVASVADMLTVDSLRVFLFDIFSPAKATNQLTTYEMGIFFSIFVLLQFWNLFNAKYFRTNRSLILDIVDLFRAPHRVKESYNNMYLAILAVILGGQIAIVTFAGQFFSVAPLGFADWLWICLITMPVLLIPDVCRFVRNVK
jgi:Ca2+-transporting ATPase